MSEEMYEFDNAMTERVRNCLAGVGVDSFEDLLSMKFNELRRIRNLGKESLMHIVWMALIYKQKDVLGAAQRLNEQMKMKPLDWQELAIKARKYEMIEKFFTNIAEEQGL